MKWLCMQSSLLKTTLLIATLLAGLLGPSSAVAQQPATPDSATPEPASTKFSIFAIGDYPNGYFEVEVEAGSSTTLTVGVGNFATDPVALRSFATNAVNPPNGGFSAGEEGDPLTDPARWLDFEATSFELDGGERWEQEFTVSVPEDTPPGQYVAALVARTDGSLELPGSDIFRQVLRSSISVEITVPGPVTPGFELGEPTFAVDIAVTMLQIPIANTGNIKVKPQGDLTVSTPEGEPILTSDVQMGSVYGGNETLVQIGIPDQMPPGDYLVSIDLFDNATGAHDALEKVTATLPERERPAPATAVTDAGPVFEIGEASVTPNGAPIQYADVGAVITNNGPAIPTANVTLNVMRDGEEVESYPLAQNQALPQGTTDFSQRYIPVDGWKEGTYTFELVISAVNGDTETVLAIVEISDEIVVP